MYPPLPVVYRAAKRGGIRPYRDVETVLQGRKTAVLMDSEELPDFCLPACERCSGSKRTL
jgi:hypothetical protein